MLTAKTIYEKHYPPTQALAPFVYEYVYRSISIPDGMTMVRDMPLRVFSSIDFFLGDPFETRDMHTGKTLPFVRCGIRGPRTFTKYTIDLRGNFISFSIRLRHGGLYRLLAIPADELRDQSIDAMTVLPGYFAEIQAQLNSSLDMAACVALIEPYLLRLATDQKKSIRPSAAVSELVSKIENAWAPSSISDLSDKIFLSRRQLERNFIREIGTTPKLFSRMIRFTHMLTYKDKFPNVNWANLAYEFHYADQMHLVRDFREFLGVPPSRFLAEKFAF